MTTQALNLIDEDYEMTTGKFKKLEVFVTSDGKEFGGHNLALEHETKLYLQQELTKDLGNKLTADEIKVIIDNHFTLSQIFSRTAKMVTLIR